MSNKFKKPFRFLIKSQSSHSVELNMKHLFPIVNKHFITLTFISNYYLISKCKC